MIMISYIADPKKLETGLTTISAGIPYTLFLRIEAIGFPTFGLIHCKYVSPRTVRFIHYLGFEALITPPMPPLDPRNETLEPLRQGP